MVIMHQSENFDKKTKTNTPMLKKGVGRSRSRMLYAYTRVSTNVQFTSNQEMAIKSYLNRNKVPGRNSIIFYNDIISGVKKEKPQLELLLK